MKAASADWAVIASADWAVIASADWAVIASAIRQPGTGAAGRRPGSVPSRVNRPTRVAVIVSRCQSGLDQHSAGPA